MCIHVNKNSFIVHKYVFVFTIMYTWLYISYIHIFSIENNSTNIATTNEGMTIGITFAASRIVERRAVKYLKGVKLVLGS
ncbi:hypothetical protein UP17_24665 [Peribacillus simplex]|nr:hypothetical protein UP17_24665 [Peribacillus simplex]